MNYLHNHINEINDLIPALHDGFIIELYDYNKGELIISGSRDFCYYTDIQISCKGVESLHFSSPSYHPKKIEITKTNNGFWSLQFKCEDENIFIVAALIEYKNTIKPT